MGEAYFLERYGNLLTLVLTAMRLRYYRHPVFWLGAFFRSPIRSGMTGCEYRGWRLAYEIAGQAGNDWSVVMSGCLFRHAWLFVVMPGSDRASSPF